MPWRSPVLPGWGQCMELEEEHPRDPTPTRRNLKLRSFSGCQATEPVPKSGDVGTSRFCGGAALAVRGPCPGIAQCVSVGSVPRAGGRDTTGCALPSVQCHPCRRASAARSHLPPQPCLQRQEMFVLKIADVLRNLCRQGSSELRQELTGSRNVTCVLSSRQREKLFPGVWKYVA